MEDQKKKDDSKKVNLKRQSSHQSDANFGGRGGMNAKKLKKRQNQEIQVYSSSASASYSPSAGATISGGGVGGIVSNQTQSQAGSSVLPRHLLVTEAISNREFEIRAMEKAISNATEHTGAIRIFQIIPRYQRRRAASHNVKRLPKYIRSRALAQMARDPDPPKTQQTRRTKRSPSRLSAFKCKSGKWLETHLWHAKRMKMVEKHGIKIALEPNQKSARSLYRAACFEAVVHDASYEKIVQIEGNVEKILQALQRISDPSIPSFGSKQYLNGSKAGSMVLHMVNQYPMGSVALVNFLWHQKSNGTKSDEGKLWIWAPLGTEQSIYTLVLNTFLYGLEDGSPSLNPTTAPRSIDGVQIGLISDMIKFQFFGARSHALLAECLQLRQQGVTFQSAGHQIWECLKTLESSTILPAGAVVGLEIQDPRLSFPIFMEKRKTPSDYDSQKHLIPIITHWPDNVAASNIWDEEIRKDSIFKRQPQAIIQKRRFAHNLSSGKRTSGNRLDFDEETDIIIPVLLIHRPGLVAGSPLTHGWDLILPKGWGQILLNVFVYAGSRVAGLNNVNTFKWEGGIPSFPTDYPEFPIQLQEAKVEEKVRTEKYKRTPKGKKFNFEMAGWINPFRPVFESLLPPANSASKPKFFVIHSERIVKLVLCHLKQKHATFDLFVEKCCLEIRRVISGRSNAADLSNLSPVSLARALVRVRLELPSGKVVSNAKIHLGPAAIKFEDLDTKVGANLIIGFTSTGGFSLSQGRCKAIGCCTLKGIYMAFKAPLLKQALFVRNPTGRLSKCCKFEVIP